MLRSAFIVFIIGWVIWFWVDKPPGGQLGLPPASDSVIENFQRAFDILKAGHPDMAFVYIWNAHYLVLSLLGGILLALAYSGISGHLSRQRMRKHFVPPARSEKAGTDKDNSPERTDAPTE